MRGVRFYFTFEAGKSVCAGYIDLIVGSAFQGVDRRGFTNTERFLAKSLPPEDPNVLIQSWELRDDCTTNPVTLTHCREVKS